MTLVMQVIEALKQRRTVRVYQRREISREILSDLVDCARLAPTAMNEQPWEFVIVTSADTKRRIAELIPHAPQTAQAAACVIILCRPTQFYVEDGAAATDHLLIAATAHGLGSCWVSGEKQPYAADVAKLVNAPAGLKLFSVVALGYPDETPVKEKRALSDVLHWEKL